MSTPFFCSSNQESAPALEVFIPKKSGSPPKPNNRKKPSLDDDIARFNYGMEFRAKERNGRGLEGKNNPIQMMTLPDSIMAWNSELR